VTHARIDVAADRLDRRRRVVPRVVAKARNRFVAADPFDDEDRLDQLRDGKRRLRQQIAQVGGSAQPKPRPWCRRTRQDVTCRCHSS
jgi:hypothetical protein